MFGPTVLLSSPVKSAIVNASPVAPWISAFTRYHMGTVPRIVHTPIKTGMEALQRLYSHWPAIPPRITPAAPPTPTASTTCGCGGGDAQGGWAAAWQRVWAVWRARRVSGATGSAHQRGVCDGESLVL